MAVKELPSVNLLTANPTKVLPCGGIRDSTPKKTLTPAKPDKIRLCARFYFAVATFFAITTWSKFSHVSPCSVFTKTHGQ